MWNLRKLCFRQRIERHCVFRLKSQANMVSVYSMKRLEKSIVLLRNLKNTLEIRFNFSRYCVYVEADSFVLLKILEQKSSFRSTPDCTFFLHPYWSEYHYVQLQLKKKCFRRWRNMENCMHSSCRDSGWMWDNQKIS